MKNLVKDYWFITGLAMVAVFAFIFPEWGCDGGVLHTEITAKLAVIIIFLFQGLVLPTDEIVTGMKRIWFHISLQSYIFLICPLIAYLVLFGVSSFIGEELQAGLLFMSVLPTTISTALVYTNRSHGNSVVSLFNIIIANVAAIFIVPLFMIAFLKNASLEVDALPLVWKVISLMLIPLIVGQIIRPRVKDLAMAYKSVINQLNSGLVLFIVFAAFSNSVVAKFWEGESVGALVVVLVSVLLIYLIIQCFSIGVMSFFRFNYQDSISYYYCGTMKSLAVGVPMGTAIFTEVGMSVGLTLLPLLFYGIIQFFLGGFLSSYLRRRIEQRVS